MSFLNFFSRKRYTNKADRYSLSDSVFFKRKKYASTTRISKQKESFLRNSGFDYKCVYCGTQFRNPQNSTCTSCGSNGVRKL